MSDSTHERVLRGIPRWLLVRYLEDLGGRRPPPRILTDSDDLLLEGCLDEVDFLLGDGWQARLTQIEDYRIGSLRSGQVRLEFTGDAEIVQAMLTALEPRLFRGGG